MRRLRLFLLACLCIGAGCRREELPAFQGLSQAAYIWRHGWDAAILPTQGTWGSGHDPSAFGFARSAGALRRNHRFSGFAAEPDPDWVLKFSKPK